jgi:hypothetical protein
VEDENLAGHRVLEPVSLANHGFLSSGLSALS